jgi:bacterioferritin-associated ferredoxin
MALGVEKNAAETRDSVPICYCKNLSQAQIEEAIRNGANTVPRLRECTGATSKCYGCLADIEALLYLQQDRSHEPEGGWRSLARYVPGVRVLRKKARLALNGVRRELAWRSNPWKLGTWVTEQADLHSRLVMCNLECPGEKRSFRDLKLTVDLYAASGKLAGRVQRPLKRNGTLVLEMRGLLAELGLKAPFHGMLEVSYKNRFVRSGRCYTQWYNDLALTASHERRFRSIFPARLYGFEALHRIFATERYLTYPVVVNCRAPRFTTHAFLANADGETLRSRAIAIPGMGALFRAVDEIFPDAERFLGGREGVMYFDTVGPLMTYYFVHDRLTGCWQGQHLE